MIERAAIAAISIALTAHSLTQPENANAALSSIVTQALGFFQAVEERNFDDYLKRVRLPKVSEALKAQALANLMRGEEVRPSAKMQAKLVALEPILRYHERETVVEIKVVTLSHAFIGLQGRAVLLISEKALYLLTTDELQATVAHEMAHEYFWGEYQEARQRKEYDAMRGIELLSDGIAVITLERLGLNPANLISGISKLNSLNRRLVNLERRPYPSLDERSEFIRAMSELVSRKRHAE